MTPDTQSRRYDVNCSILFTELPLHAGPAAVLAAGFHAIEYWWPFLESPTDKSVEALIGQSGTLAYGR
jgi:hydroxypyruvate isomerase